MKKLLSLLAASALVLTIVAISRVAATSPDMYEPCKYVSGLAKAQCIQKHQKLNKDAGMENPTEGKTMMMKGKAKGMMKDKMMDGGMMEEGGKMMSKMKKEACKGLKGLEKARCVQKYKKENKGKGAQGGPEACQGMRGLERALCVQKAHKSSSSSSSAPAGSSSSSSISSAPASSQ